jgi:hypothetical protein
MIHHPKFLGVPNFRNLKNGAGSGIRFTSENITIIHHFGWLNPGLIIFKPSKTKGFNSSIREEFCQNHFTGPGA